MPEDVLVTNILNAMHRSGVKPVLLWLLGWCQESFYLEVFKDLCDTFMSPLDEESQGPENGGPAS